MALASARRSYDGVVACQPVTIPYRRYSTESAVWWIGRALHELTKQTGPRPTDLDGFSLSRFTAGPDPAIGLTQHLGLSPRWLDHIPLGGASGVVALRRAARAVQAGDADIVACVGADTNHVDFFRKTLSTFSRFAQDAVYPYSSGGPNASFALITRKYMNCYCVIPCAGAEAFLVCREEAARAQGWAHVRVLATIERHNAFPDDPIQVRGGWAMDIDGWAMDIDELWAMAVERPDDIDFVETYDDYPVISMLQFEDLGFCGKGEGPDFVRSHDLTNGGSFPHNTSGGQLSVGLAGAAGGYLGLAEAIRQLTGAVLGEQMPDARIGLVSGFGMINYDRGLSSCASILARLA